MIKQTIALLVLLAIGLSGAATAFAEAAPAAGHGRTTPSGIELEKLEEFVDEYVESRVGKTLAGASIVIVKDGQTVLSKGYGYADREKQAPVTRSTVFEWGSISKLVVWIGVMQLAEQGKLDLNADIRAYLPDDILSGLTYREPITMLNLMNHNAGFEEYMFDMAYTSPEKVRSLEEGLKLARPAQIYKPGEVVAYSNYSTTLAAYIVERISGRQFHAYAEEQVFSKLGMNETTAHPTLENRPELIAEKASGYLLAGEDDFAPGSWNYMSMYPNGGNNGTAEDLAKLAVALMPAEGESSPLFARPDTLAEMLARSYSADANMPGIAHGFWEYPGARRTLGHGGNTIAFSSQLQFVPEERFAVIVMTNQAAESDIVHGLSRALTGMRDLGTLQEGLPDSAQLQGSFIAARRPAYGFMSLYPYLTLLNIEPLGAKDIRVSLAGLTAEYRQVKPFLYEKGSGDDALDAFPMLHFKVTGGKVDKISMYTTDYLPLPAGKSRPLLLLNAVLAAVSVAFFILSPLVMLARALWRRRKKTERSPAQSAMRRLVAGLSLTGTGLVANNLLLAARMLSRNERAYSEVWPQLVANRILTGLAVALAVWLALYWMARRPKLTLRQKWATLLPVVLLAALIGLLAFWQFYR
ncbi:serine hydrolase domain-containing protein [Cohnella boryungensis]|uniref:Serine hydrolase domain-containing protein n=1 Tax=Cohnella boryungensis TaxID=768479 RepID=A0ABV8SG01_9BACL